jgi:hypothetical protein
MRIRLRSRYTSGWFTVGIPLATFLSFFIGLPVLTMGLLNWQLPDAIGFALYGLGFLLGIVASVALYPFLMWLANRQTGEIEVDGSMVRWRSGRRWHSVDLERPYWAQIAAGPSGCGEPNASVSLNRGQCMVHLAGSHRQEVLQFFPEPYFLAETAILPQEGLWGFKLDLTDPEHRSLFHTLLQALWRTRKNNEYYILFSKFPWERRPDPAFTHIQTLHRGLMTEEQQFLIEEMEDRVLSAPTWSARLTPDYLLGADSKNYYLMPLGHIYSEEGTVGSADADRPLRIFGIDIYGRRITVRLPCWVTPGDDTYEEGQLLVRFVNRPSDLST